MLLHVPPTSVAVPASDSPRIVITADFHRRILFCRRVCTARGLVGESTKGCRRYGDSAKRHHHERVVRSFPSAVSSTEPSFSAFAFTRSRRCAAHGCSCTLSLIPSISAFVRRRFGCWTAMPFASGLCPPPCSQQHGDDYGDTRSGHPWGHSHVQIISADNVYEGFVALLFPSHALMEQKEPFDPERLHLIAAIN
jgi:hypothetical protein